MKAILKFSMGIFFLQFHAFGQSITAGSIGGSPFCPGAAITVPYSSTGVTFGGTNKFTAQLSSATGSFASPTSIGTLTSSSASGTISATIPSGAAAGTGYRIRVACSSPSSGVSYVNNGTDLAIVSAAQCAATWSTSGNVVNGGGNFIGTLNSTPLVFRMKNVKSGIVDTLNNTSLGYMSQLFNTSGNANTSMGFASLYSNTTGYQNIAMGHLSLHDNTTGFGNTGVGVEALYYNQTGYYNTAVGFRSLVVAGTGSMNTAVGSLSLNLNSIGSSNTAVGSYSLFKNVSGSNNTSYGYSSLLNNSTGNSNTALGYQSLYSNNANDNTAVGYQSLYSNTVGGLNTANGYQSLLSNTEGGGNTGYGYVSLRNNTTGYWNTAGGAWSLVSNVTGAVNTAFGYSALQSNVSGNYNVGIGYQSLVSNQAGQFNIAIGGRDASFQNIGGSFNVAIGTSALYNNLSSRNTAIGTDAMSHYKIGTDNTGIGFGADVSMDNMTNSTVIGANAVVNASNKVRIGNAAVTSIEGQVAYTYPSDGRFKTNIKEDAPGIDFIMKLRPVTYNFQYNRFSDFLKEKNIDKDQLRKREARKEMGLVAQEVEKAMKDLHIELENLVHAPANESDNYSLAYGELVVPLIKAVQEQQKQIEELRKIMGLSQNQPSPSAFQINPVSGRNDLQTTGVLLGQNIPNPVTRMTIIPFRIPGNCTDAAIVITSMATGQIVKAIPISCKETQLNIDASKLSSGTYSYSLYIEGKSVETKRMILTK